VGGGGGLVEDDERDVAKERPGQRHALPLSDGEVLAVPELGAEHGVVAVRQPGEELVRAGLAGGGGDRGQVVGVFVAAQPDVVPGRECVVQEVLVDHRDRAAQLLRVDATPAAAQRRTAAAGGAAGGWPRLLRGRLRGPPRRGRRRYRRNGRGQLHCSWWATSLGWYPDGMATVSSTAKPIATAVSTARGDTLAST
jgi:hypothetical protein